MKNGELRLPVKFLLLAYIKPGFIACIAKQHQKAELRRTKDVQCQTLERQATKISQGSRLVPAVRTFLRFKQSLSIPPVSKLTF